MLSNVRILPRLLIGFGVLILLIASLSGFSIYSGQSSHALIKEVDRLKVNEVIDQLILKQVFEGRMQVWMALATDDQDHWQKAAALFEIAHKDLTTLIAGTADPSRLAEAEALQSALTSYEAVAAKEKQFRGRNLALASPDATAIVAEASLAAGKIDEIAEPLAEGYRKAASAMSTSALDAMARTIDIAIVVGIASILIGVGMALLIARSIAKPINAMTGTMGRLARRDMTAEIAGRDRKDEIGDMASAVKVFKDSMIEADRLAAAQAAEAEVKMRRAEALDVLTGAFERRVGDLVGSLSSAATEMEATAQSMSSTAEETSRQASAVAVASEQTSANVQTVASATDEMSSSIGEIGRQVIQSAKIAAKAVEDARRSDTTAQQLVVAAEKIGAVVSLIQNIAAQTKLLALNATIEAARAGEAGSGFSVVASEVKSLADQTAVATTEIAEQIAALQAASNETVATIKDVITVISEIDGITAAIASAVEEQGAATKEIARNVDEAAQGVKEVASNISGVRQAAGDTGTAANQVLVAAGEISRQSEDLTVQVNQFLAGVRAA